MMYHITPKQKTEVESLLEKEIGYEPPTWVTYCHDHLSILI